jgi:hypothetical protein
MPVWRNKQCRLTNHIETYLIRSGGVTEKDPVKLINTFHRHLIWKAMIRCAYIALKVSYIGFPKWTCSLMVEAAHS